MKAARCPENLLSLSGPCVCVCVCVCVRVLSRVRLFVTLWTIAHHASLSMGLVSWSRLPFPLPGDLPNVRIEPVTPALQALLTKIYEEFTQHKSKELNNLILKWADY